MKTAVVIISDPKAGKEALARVFNALAVASEGKHAGDEVEVSFIGTGTRLYITLCGFRLDLPGFHVGVNGALEWPRACCGLWSCRSSR